MDSVSMVMHYNVFYSSASLNFPIFHCTFFCPSSTRDRRPLELLVELYVRDGFMGQDRINAYDFLFNCSCTAHCIFDILGEQYHVTENKEHSVSLR